jgi:class 3 adenylate cyclase
MSATASVLAAAIIVAAVAAVAAWRAWREAHRLRERMEQASEELEQLQQSFRRFAPGEVIEALIQGVRPPPERREVTVLVADLVGFTALSERLDPAVLVEVLNGYLDRMSRTITENRGHVSKFLGDGILALFGALSPNPWHADDAVRAALAMRELASGGFPILSIGIGIERGPVIAGVIGTRELEEYTVIGRTVNVAARVQAATREHAVDILITDNVRGMLDRQVTLRPLPPATLKGVSDRVAIWAVEGRDTAETRPSSGTIIASAPR